MQNKIYIGNLPYSSNEESINDVFSQFGEITDSIVIKDRDTGRSKGFGFVTFDSADAANDAVKTMDGQDIDGRKIKVNIAQEKKRESSGGRSGGGNW